MAIENTNFKVGDRVRYFGEADEHEDYGTVMPDDAVDNIPLWTHVNFWVKWESDGKILQVRPSDVELVDSQQSYSEPTIQSCIDFLISQGYTVSLSKN